MKKIVFIISHLGSGSSSLINSLNENPRCLIYESKNNYEHPESIELLTKYHKLSNFSCAVYGDHILYNHSIIHNDFYNYFKFIYIIRSPKESLNIILKKHRYSKNGAYNYYRFRLRRMCEMAKKTKNFILFNYEQLFDKKNIDKINNYLDLLEPIQIKNDEKELKNEFSNKVLIKSQDCYEKYYYYLSNLYKKEEK